MRKTLFLLAVVVCSTIGVFAQNDVTQGMLSAFDSGRRSIGACPLKHTDVKVEISGFLARVKVTQEFENNFNQPIEAVYKFPLPEDSAVDDMTMLIGNRRIRAKIMKREEAREVYENAKDQGQTAALLDQERPNIFTQQVANILPNEKIIVEINFVETLKYEDGEYEFVFPMTVGERYIPASMSTQNALNVTPNITKSRAGHDISVEVNLDAGVPVEQIRSTSHLIETMNFSEHNATIKLKNEKAIPNKDFILRYDVTGKRIEDAILTHRDERGGFFTMILSPPEDFGVEDITPKEIVFLLDVSGSMYGFPLEKAKEAMRLSLKGLNPRDTFNLMTFAGETRMLFEKPVPATAANLNKAQAFLASQRGGGGTEMMTAIRAALEPSDSQEHIRIVCFMTDGYVGNDLEIIGEVQKHPNARVFGFGIGSSVNRFLLDKVSEMGRGEVEYVSLQDNGDKAAQKFYERVRTPLLTDISIDWNGLPVVENFPKQIPDLFSAKPVIIHGRYLKAESGTIRLNGKVGGQTFSREISVNLPEIQKQNDVLATLWARTKIDDLMAKDWEGIQNGNAKKEVEESITKLGLEYNLLTQFTSFVAVENIRTQDGQPKQIVVGTENAEGVRNNQEENENLPAPPPKSLPSKTSNKGFNTRKEMIRNINESPTVPPKVNTSKNSQETLVKLGDSDVRGTPMRGTSRTYNSGNGSGIATTVPKTISGGVINGKAVNLPQPEYPSAAKTVGASGTVSVQILVDENGNVISATPVSGHPLLRSAAAIAAQNAKFAPTMLAGQPIKVSGIITYVFANGQQSIVNSSTSIPDEVAPPPTPQMAKQRQMEEKFHPQILALVESLKDQTVEAKFVSDGKAEIEIWLTEITPEIKIKLEEPGFEIVEEKQQKFVIGKIAVENLASLAEIAEVQYVLPKMN